jgi:hypothetical protein
MILTQYPAETPRRDAGAGGWQGGSMTRTAPVFTLTPGPAGATPATLAALGLPARPGDRTGRLGRALRRTGAVADVGAALGHDPHYPPA